MELALFGSVDRGGVEYSGDVDREVRIRFPRDTRAVSRLLMNGAGTCRAAGLRDDAFLSRMGRDGGSGGDAPLDHSALLVDARNTCSR